jgi:hypothetical protein
MEGDLSRARYRIESGKALNWVPGELRHATLWAMQACLMAYGHEEEEYSGWDKVLAAFITLIPSDIRHPLFNCYFDAVSLDSYEGDWDSWKKLVVECLKDTEKEIIRIKTVIEKQMKIKPGDKRL